MLIVKEVGIRRELTSASVVMGLFRCTMSRWRRQHARSAHHPESNITGGAVRRIRAARCDPIAIAIGIVAEERAAAQRTVGGGFALQGIFSGGNAVIARRKIILAPFPDISRDVMQTVAVRRKSVDRRGAGIAILGGIAIRKAALPDIAAMLACRRRFIAPWIVGL